MTDDPFSIIGQVLVKRYRIQRYLGGGGFGFVYLAYDQDLKDEIALKFPRESSFNEGIVREARTLHALDKRSASGHVVKFYALVDIGGKQTLVTEYCRGGALSDRLRKSGHRGSKTPLSTLTTCRIATQVCKGLEDAHALKCVHRDIKPENIFLSEPSVDSGVVKLGDFGIAKILETQGLTRIGTKCYMAPEILEGKGADLRSDVYSLGVTIYELLTGTMPHDHNLPEYLLMKAIVNGEITPLSNHSHVDPRLYPIVGRAMNVDPGSRYARVSDLRVEFEEAEVELAVEAELAKVGKGTHGIDAEAKLESCLEDLCRRFPKNQRPYLELAQMLRRRGLTSRAVDIYQQALSQIGQDPRILCLLAQNYAAMEKWFPAVGAMEQALDISTGPASAAADRLDSKEIDSAKKLVAAWKKAGTKK